MKQTVKDNVFRLLAILTLGNFYLPIVFTNLPFPLNSPTFYLAIWTAFVLFSQPSILLSKQMIVFYIFILILFLGSGTIWSDRIMNNGSRINVMWIKDEVGWAFLAILMYKYFITNKDYQGLIWILSSYILFISITSVTSIIGLDLFPNASRILAVGDADINGLRMHEIYRRIGIAEYGFYAGVAFSIPALVYLINHSIKNKYIKFSLVTIIAVMIFSMVKAEHTTILIFAVLLLLISLIHKWLFSGNVALKILLSIIIFVFLLPIISVSLNLVANKIDSDEVRVRLRDFSVFISEADFDPGSGKTYTAGERFSRSLYSFSSFLENPIYGTGKNSEHAHWLDRLAIFGLIGALPWLIIFIGHYKKVLFICGFEERRYYLISLIAFLIFGLLKAGIEGQQVMTCILFIVPGVYSVTFHLKNIENNENRLSPNFSN